jgi:hypothetical protein
MKRRTHEVRERKPENVIQIRIDISSVPSQDRKFSRLKNRSQVFDDRRKRKPKYKPNYMED